MADPYPSVPQKVGGTKVSSFGTVVDRAVSGKPRFRTPYSEIRHVFKVIHECSTADKVSIEDHFDAWGEVSFNFVYAADGNTYVVRYAERPITQVIDGDYWWNVESTLVVV